MEKEMIKMKYLVKIKSVETGLLPPEQSIMMLEKMIIPSLDALVELESKGKILAAGGVVAARNCLSGV
jgi:hypothetical protein